jgi:hypothetical protein
MNHSPDRAWHPDCVVSDERIIAILGAQPPDGSSLLRKEVLRGIILDRGCR